MKYIINIKREFNYSLFIYEEWSGMGEREHTYNMFYTKDRWLNVNKENKDILNDYIMEIKSKKLKPTTVAQYFNDGRIVMLYIMDKLNNISILNLKRKDFRNMSLFFVEECNMSNARVNRLFSFVHMILDYCEDNSEDYAEYDTNNSKKIKGLPKEKIREHTFLTDEQIHKLSEELLKKEKYLDNALLWTLYDTGSRKSEIAQLNKPLNKEQRKMNKVIGKRGKEYCPILLDRSQEAIWIYLDKRGEDDIEALFVINNDRMKIGTLYDRVVSWGDILTEIEGEEYTLTVHNFRHMFIENMTNGTHYWCKKVGKLPIEKVQLLVRHSDLSTTNSYKKDRGDDEVMELLGL